MPVNPPAASAYILPVEGLADILPGTRHVLAVTHPSRHRVPAVTDLRRHRDHALHVRRDSSESDCWYPSR